MGCVFCKQEGQISVFIMNGPIRSTSENLDFLKKWLVKWKLRSGEFTLKILRNSLVNTFQNKKWITFLS